jgi:protein-S-isoprenylcysteine O-methyltransferase Ste14
MIAFSAQMLFHGKIKKKASLFMNIIVAVPYLIMFGWFALRTYIGAYKPYLWLQLLGLVCIIIGVSGYITSIFFLRSNWAVSACIKEDHTFISTGPYKFVRHPMYFFMITTILGSGLLISNYLIILYTPVVIAIYYVRAKKEEELLKEAFLEYKYYIQKTKMLIPGIF